MSKKAICPHLTDCINTSFNNCVHPEELKTEIVSPDFTSKEPYLKSNYKPISALPSVSNAGLISVLSYQTCYQVSEKAIAHNMPYFRFLKHGGRA